MTDPTIERPDHDEPRGKLSRMELIAIIGKRVPDMDSATAARLAIDIGEALFVNGEGVPGLPVAGYKPTQPPEAIAAVNRNKHIEEMILRDMDELAKANAELRFGTPAPGIAAVDARWLAIARTKIEEAFMAYNRAIFQPTRVDGDLRAFWIPEAAADADDESGNALTHGA